MDIFNRKPKQDNNAILDEFHDELAVIVSVLNSTYVEAFVQHMDGAGMGNCSRKTIDQYLFGKGFSEVDIKILVDEYFRIVNERGTG